MDAVPVVYFAIFVTYSMLPLPKRIACVLGILAAISHVVITGATVNSHREHIVQQVNELVGQSGAAINAEQS